MRRQVNVVALSLVSIVVVAIGVGLFLLLKNPTENVALGRRIPSKSALNPDALYSPKAELIYTGWNLPVEMTRKLEPGKVRFEFSTLGTVVDSETELYETNEQVFGLMEMNMEAYSPPIPLLKFPMNVGETWQWKGVQESGGRQHKAWADIKSKIVKMPEIGIEEAVQVTVSLFVESNAGRPSERSIEFWFTKGRGIVKRTYGEAIARISLDPGDGQEQE